MQTHLVALALVVLTGCAAGETPTPDPTAPTGTTSSSSSGSGSGGAASNPQGYESGSRLRARILVGEDGSKERVGFYDTKRAENCYWRLLGDGKQHCVPLAGGAVAFADAACTIPVLLTPCASIHEKYIAQELNGGPGCVGDLLYRIYEVGGQQVPQVFYGPPSACSALTPVPVGTIAILASAQPLADSEFVLANESVE